MKQLKQNLHYLLTEMFSRLEGYVSWEQMPSVIQTKEAVMRLIQPDTVVDVSAKHIVCAAMLMDDGLIVTGVRHFSPDMRATLKRIYGDGYHLHVKEQGFIDTSCKFLDRQQAWNRAVITNQIFKSVSTPDTLYSENLY